MIRVNNFTDFDLSPKRIRKIANFILEREKKKGFSVNIDFVPSEKIKELNKKYRKKNRPTDVLSFKNDECFVLPPGREKELGEMVICLGQVAINAKSLNIGVREEISRVLIHGILHLLGYDHEKDKGEFFKKQKFYLDIL